MICISIKYYAKLLSSSATVSMLITRATNFRNFDGKKKLSHFTTSSSDSDDVKSKDVIYRVTVLERLHLNV